MIRKENKRLEKQIMETLERPTPSMLKACNRGIQRFLNDEGVMTIRSLALQNQGSVCIYRGNDPRTEVRFIDRRHLYARFLDNVGIGHVELVIDTESIGEVACRDAIGKEPENHYTRMMTRRYGRRS